MMTYMLHFKDQEITRVQNETESCFFVKIHNVFSLRQSLLMMLFICVKRFGLGSQSIYRLIFSITDPQTHFKCYTLRDNPSDDIIALSVSKLPRYHHFHTGRHKSLRWSRRVSLTRVAFTSYSTARNLSALTYSCSFITLLIHCE